MIPATSSSLLAVVVYIGVFAFRRSRGHHGAEDYFLANRSLGTFVFLMSLFGTNMTAFAILGSSGHAFSNGIVTFGLMATSSALVIPLTIFLIGTRVWALGKKYGFMTPVQMFRDRWECGHIGTVILAVQAVCSCRHHHRIMGVGDDSDDDQRRARAVSVRRRGRRLVVMSYVFSAGCAGRRGSTRSRQFSFSLRRGRDDASSAEAWRFANAVETMQNSPALAPAPHRSKEFALLLFQLHLIPLIRHRLPAHRNLSA